MTFFGRKCRFVKMTLKMLVSRLSESKNEEEGVLCLVGFCIGARSRGREGKRAVVYGSIVFHANWSVLIVSHKRQIIGSNPSRHPAAVTTTTPLPLPNLPEFFQLPVLRCLKGGNDSLSTSLRIVKLNQHGRFVHSAESQTALAGYVASYAAAGLITLWGRPLYFSWLAHFNLRVGYFL